MLMIHVQGANVHLILYQFILKIYGAKNRINLKIIECAYSVNCSNILIYNE